MHDQAQREVPLRDRNQHLTTKRDHFIQLTKAFDSAEIRNGETFRLACCDCHLVHDAEVWVEKLPDGAPLVIYLRSNWRLTKARRKLKGKSL